MNQNYRFMELSQFCTPLHWAAHGVVGGTASALSGGKFANGAQTAAYGYLFNETISRASHAKNERQNLEYTTPNGNKYRYNKISPGTVPVSGETKKTLDLMIDKMYANGNITGTIVVSGGAEVYGHEVGSAHYTNKAIDIWGETTGNYVGLNNELVYKSAYDAGFTHGHWDTHHWHVQIGTDGYSSGRAQYNRL